MANPPTDHFKDAEQSIDKQKMDALAALAQFGRRGLDAAVANRARTVEGGATEAKRVSDLTGRMVAYNPAAEAELAAIAAPTTRAYNLDASQAVRTVRNENAASRAVQSNYFDQARQVVPLLRTNAQSITDQYRKAYEERQAQIQQQQQMLEMARQQAMIQMDTQRQAMEQAAAIHQAQMASIASSGAGGGGGSAGGEYGPDPLAQEQHALAVQDAARRAWETAQAEQRKRNAPQNTWARGRWGRR